MRQVDKYNPSVMQIPSAENQTETKAIELSPEQRVRLARRSALGIVQVLCAQVVLALVVIVLSWWVSGKYAAASALVGAGAYFLPNSIFAVRLLLGLVGGTNANAASFFIGEILKLGAAVALLALAVWQFNAWLVWPALLFGLIGVLKGYVVLLALGKLP